MATEQSTVSLLSLIASTTLSPGGFSSTSVSDRAKNDAQAEEQRAQTMMYAARMKYLQDTDQVKPDALFMTRKQAQKLAMQDSMTTISLRKLDMSGKSPNGAIGAADVKGGAAGQGTNISPNWKKPRGVPVLDDRHQTWIPVTQAGCHFWQSEETGECRSTPPAGWEGNRHPDEREASDDDEMQGEDPPFPSSFAFLNDGRQQPK